MSEFRLNLGGMNNNNNDDERSEKPDTGVVNGVTIDNFLDNLNFDGNKGVFHRIVGVDDGVNENMYAESVYVLFDELKAAGLSYTFVQDRLHSEFSELMKSEIERFWVTVTKIKNLTVDDMLKYTFDLRTWSMDPSIVSRVRVGFKYVLELFMKNEKNLSIVKNFFVKMWTWIDTYIEGDTFDTSIFVYFGESKRDEAYFMMLLNMMGSNILAICPKTSGGFSKVLDIEAVSSVEEFSKTLDLDTLPKRPEVRRVETVASKASREIHSILNSDSSGVYKPWQFEDYGVKVTSLDTTYEEILQLWKEPANMRTGFDVKDGVVYVPNMFAKVVGVPDIVDNYWIDVAELREGNTVFKESVPFTAKVYHHKQGIVYGRNGFTLSDVRKLSEYRFNHVRESMQEMMIERLNMLIESADSIFRFEGVTTNDFKYRALHTVLALDKAFVDQIQKFDYAQDIPKLVVFDGDDQVCSEDDAIVLAYLHLIGFDIVILTPTGYQNIEHLINKSYFDVHKKKKFEMGLTLPTFGVKVGNAGASTTKKSWIQRLFE